MQNRFRVYRWALALGLVSAAARAVAQPNAVDIFAAASQSVVTIVTFDRQRDPRSQGSGVVVAKERVVTNCHVLEGGDAVGIVFQSIGMEARIVDSMIERDLCLLEVSGLGAPAVTLGTIRELRVGQRVFTLGAPYGLDLTFSEGMISSLRGQGEDNIIQISAPISPGSSGGALLSRDGRLIGITTLQHSTGQNLNFAVPVDWITQFRTLHKPPRRD